MRQIIRQNCHQIHHKLTTPQPKAMTNNIHPSHRTADEESRKLARTAVIYYRRRREGVRNLPAQVVRTLLLAEDSKYANPTSLGLNLTTELLTL